MLPLLLLSLLLNVCFVKTVHSSDTTAQWKKMYETCPDFKIPGGAPEGSAKAMIRLKAGDRSAVEIVNPIMTMRARGRPTTRRREALHQKPRTMRACRKCGNMNADHDTRNCGGASELPFSMNQSGTQPRARAKRHRIPPPSDLPPPVPSFSASAPRRGSRTRKPTAKAVRVECVQG